MSVPEGLCLISLGIEPRSPKLDQMKAQSRSMAARFAVATVFFFSFFFFRLPLLEFCTAKLKKKKKLLTLLYSKMNMADLSEAYSGSDSQ